MLVIHLLAVNCHGQHTGTIKKPLSKADKANGMLVRYGNEKPDYAWLEIELFKNHTFHYKGGDDLTGNKFSEGEWVKKKDTIILNSSLDSENVPVTIKYIRSGTGAGRRSKIMPIKNLNDSLLVLTGVLINSEASFCMPHLDTCLGVAFKKIDSIKVCFFETGLNSKWVRVTEENYDQLQIVADINFDPLEYRPIYNEKYIIAGKYLKWIVEDRLPAAKGPNNNFPTHQSHNPVTFLH